MENMKKIIISRTDKIGDLLLSIPSFYMLRKMYPSAEITVLVRNYNYDIVKNLKYIDRVVKIDDYAKKDLLNRIEFFKADAFIALYSDSFVGELAKKSKAKIRIGAYSKPFSFFCYNKGIFQRRSKSVKNEAEYNLDLVRKLNPTLFDSNYEINTDIVLDENSRLVAKRFYEEQKIEGEVLVINPFMGGSAKNINIEQYASLIKKILEKKPKLQIILTLHASDEKDGHELLELINKSNVHLFSSSGSILNLAAIIEKSNLYFGGSTGPTHIAGALNKKIVAIYPNKKTQHPIRWGIFGNNKKVDYLIIDKDNKEENYKNKYFDNYTSELEEELLKLILQKL